MMSFGTSLSPSDHKLLGMPTTAFSSFGHLAAGLDASNGTSASMTVLNHPPPPVLIGGLVALFLSGAVFMQVIIYFQMYQSDSIRTKSIVLAVWLLDIAHSALVCTANWEALITDYGAFEKLDNILWSISVTIALTAFTTVIVHCFFIYRIFRLSHRNWYITVPLLALAVLRVASALVTTAEMLRLQSYVLFIKDYTYIFTLGLATSASLDILITAILCYYLRRGRDGFAQINHMIDLLTLYTVETGMLTCIATALSLFFWLFMRGNFVFLGMHLAINKLYANSLLASLNARKSLASRAQGSGQGERYHLPVMLPHPPQSPRDFLRRQVPANPAKQRPLEVTIDVERTIQHDTVLEPDSPPLSDSEPDHGARRKSGNSTLTDARRAES